ncbi:MAG: tyrosine--tRNA ligase [Candidatus Hydrothermarchaeota archaeon]
MIDLIGRNTIEIITQKELEEVIKKKDKIAYVGYEPSGKIHLGHMLTINKMIDLQKADFKIIILLADLHAYLNKKGKLKEIREIADYNKDCFLAMGLDPKKTDFLLGSDIQLSEDYSTYVYKLALETTIKRARRSMDTISREEADPKVAQVIYPLMQVVDMIVLDVDVAVGGIDQRKIHMLARDNLPKLGFKPPVCIHLPLIHGLDGEEKMSSSKNNFISVDDSPDEIEEKIKKSFCPPKISAGNPIMEIFKYQIFPKFNEIEIKRPEKYGGDLTLKSYEELERMYTEGKLHPVDLKNSCFEYIESIVGNVRDKLGRQQFGRRNRGY